MQTMVKSLKPIKRIRKMKLKYKLIAGCLGQCIVHGYNFTIKELPSLTQTKHIQGSVSEVLQVELRHK